MSAWIANAVIYQVNLRALAAREPRNPIEAAAEPDDPASPLAYLADHLEVLRDLGVNVLHLMPPFPMGMEARKGIGSPYAASDYTRVDPEYGTDEELRALVGRAREAGFRVILGVVPNHTSRDHVWTRQQPAYYVRGDDGRPAYDLDWSDTAKLDYRQPGLRQAMIDVYDHWLSGAGDPDGRSFTGVDGFRLDMAHFINDRGFWNEAVAELQLRHPGREILFLAECYGQDNNLDLFDRGINAAYDDELYKIWEYFYGVDADGRSLLLDPSEDALRSEGFRDKLEAYRGGGIAGAVARAVQSYVDRLGASAPLPRLARYTDNHDEGRGHYRFGTEASRAMFESICLLPNTIPFLLTGQEVGAMNRPSIHERIQPCDKGRRVQGPDGVRRQEGVEFEGNLFARGRKARRDLQAFYRALLRFRRDEPALRAGAFTFLDPDEAADPARRTLLAFERVFEGRCLRCFVNLGHLPATARAEDLLRGRVIYGEDHGNVFPPFSTRVLVKPTG